MAYSAGRAGEETLTRRHTDTHTHTATYPPRLCATTAVAQECSSLKTKTPRPTAWEDRVHGYVGYWRCSTQGLRIARVAAHRLWKSSFQACYLLDFSHDINEILSVLASTPSTYFRVASSRASAALQSVPTHQTHQRHAPHSTIQRQHQAHNVIVCDRQQKMGHNRDSRQSRVGTDSRRSAAPPTSESSRRIATGTCSM